MQATNGDIGKMHDLFFDDQDLMVHYLVADIGTWVSGRKVLLFPVARARPDWKRLTIPVELSKERILNSPPITEDTPISRQHEKELYEYFALTPCWPIESAPYGSVVHALTPVRFGRNVIHTFFFQCKNQPQNIRDEQPEDPMSNEAHLVGWS